MEKMGGRPGDRARASAQAALLGASLIALQGAAFAQTPAEESETTGVTVIGQRSTYGQGNISSATKTDTPLIDAPQSVSVVTHDLIEDQGMRSMADVVRYVPGVSMGQGEGHRDAPTLRGNASTADFFVDGVRDDVQYFRDLYNAERIEVLKGPNAMIFGRGGGGGVINRVTEQADWIERREIALTGGSWNQRRVAVDFGQGVSDLFALRLNGVYEDSDSYRDFVNVERYGVNPTASLALSESTRVRLGYEYFDDYRTVDRGVPSQNGRPAPVDESTFFGNPDLSWAEAKVNLANATIEHEFGPNLRLRNHTLYGDYDKFYQNIHANSPVSNTTGDVTLQAYNSSTVRENVFNQTDLVWETRTGAVEHTILAGLEFGRQETDNFRLANFTPGIVNIANPTTFAPVVFAGRPVQTDNHVDTNLAAAFLQDQIAFGDHFLMVAGLRYDRFDLEVDDFLADPNEPNLGRVDEFVSPRLGLILKPAENASLYASYSVSYLPQSGDQFGSLSDITAGLEPEEFENLEVGVKLDIRPALSLTAGLYRLDRTNTPVLDPQTNLTMLTGSQRSEGLELQLAGALTDRWEIIAGYVIQDAEITSGTSTNEGKRVPLVPEQTFSLWNNYRFSDMWGAGLGVIHQTDMFASISNNVTLPDFTRVDAALFLALNEHVEAQLNVENVFDETYWGTAHNDNNITPGSPRAVRVGLTTRF